MSKNYDNEEKEEKEKKSSYHLCSENISFFKKVKGETSVQECSQQDVQRI